jgi:opacity protein-like surface antigen
LKLFLLFFILLSSLYADAKLYVGTSLAYQYEIMVTPKKKGFNTTNNLNLKIGYGDIDAYAVEFSFDYAKNDSNILSENDDTKYGINVELLKSFNFDLFFKPYVKVGFNVGFMSTSRAINNNVTYGGFNFGGGAFIPVSDHVDFELGYLYKSITYEQINLLDQYVKPVSDQSNGYVGINFRF